MTFGRSLQIRRGATFTLKLAAGQAVDTFRPTGSVVT